MRMRTCSVVVGAATLLTAGLMAQQPAADGRARPSGSARPATRESKRPGTGEAPHAQTAAGLPADAQHQLVNQYCTGCHNDRTRAGGLSLAAFDAAAVVEHADVTEKMIRKLRAGMMPPPQARRPDPALVAAFVDALETRLDRAAALNPNPGWRPFQRLNRAEYRRAVRDLLGIDVDVNAYLPPDTISS